MFAKLLTQYHRLPKWFRFMLFVLAQPVLVVLAICMSPLYIVLKPLVMFYFWLAYKWENFK